MKNLKEGEFAIRKEGKVLAVLTYQELIFLANLSLDDDYEEMVKMEEKIPGSTKVFLLDAIKTMCIGDVVIDIRVKIAKSLYSKFIHISENDAFYIRQQIFEVGEVYIFELLDRFLEDTEVA